MSITRRSFMEAVAAACPAAIYYRSGRTAFAEPADSVDRRANSSKFWQICRYWKADGSGLADDGITVQDMHMNTASVADIREGDRFFVDDFTVYAEADGESLISYGCPHPRQDYRTSPSFRATVLCVIAVERVFDGNIYIHATEADDAGQHPSPFLVWAGKA